LRKLQGHRLFKSDRQPDAITFWFWGNFEKRFLRGTGLVESNVSAATSRIQKLCRRSVDGPIITGLGGEPIVEMSLAHIAALLKEQPQGEDGKLQTNGRANILYVRDMEGVLWAVNCSFPNDHLWLLEAIPLTNPREWRVGGQIFSC
jgi:hypothetical protein